MTGPFPLDEGLRRRLAAAGTAIAWRSSRPAGAKHRAVSSRIARLRDEEARVETREGPGGTTVEVTAGPVGAVILLLEADRRGPPSSLGSRNGARGGPFPDGSIAAQWGAGELAGDARPTLRDLVELARYALP